jgi:AcrR family transcriptional regulator
MPDDGRSKRAEAAREARREQILASSLKTFAQRGYYQTSVTDLVSAAGVARGTFYLYFDSKSAIFLELLDELLVRLRASVARVDRSAGSPPMEAQLHAIVLRLLEALTSNRDLTRVVFREAVGLDDEVDARLRAFYGSLRGFVVHALDLGVAMGVVREGLDRGVTAAAIVGSLRGVVTTYVVESDAPFDGQAVASAIVDLTMRGIIVADPADSA